MCDYLGKSPLYRACEVGRRDIVETLLLQYGASPEAADVRSDLFPLHTAVKKKDVEIVKVSMHGMHACMRARKESSAAVCSFTSCFESDIPLVRLSVNSVCVCLPCCVSILDLMYIRVCSYQTVSVCRL